MSILRTRADAVMVREIENEFLLLDTESNRIHQLNRTASFIWRRCEGAASPATIAAELAMEFDVDEERALNDVHRTLNTLRSLALIAES